MTPTVPDQSDSKRVVLLAGPGAPTHMMYNALKGDFAVARVILEDPVPAQQFLRRRIKTLGVVKVAGQVLFRLCAVPLLTWGGKSRARKIKEMYGLDATPIPAEKVLKVASVNSEEAISELRGENPDVVMICGTRILAKSVLNAISCPFVNIHTGITPLYRGVHGGYWALVQKDAQACGVTVHIVDAGIDTGRILGQALIYPTPQDNFTTYPLLQLGEGFRLLKKVLKNLRGGSLDSILPSQSESRLWYHPTLWEYVWHRVIDGVR